MTASESRFLSGSFSHFQPEGTPRSGCPAGLPANLREVVGAQARMQDFGQGGSRVLTPKGALSLKFAQNRTFPLKIAQKTT